MKQLLNGERHSRLEWQPILLSCPVTWNDGEHSEYIVANQCVIRIIPALVS